MLFRPAVQGEDSAHADDQILALLQAGPPSQVRLMTATLSHDASSCMEFTLSTQ